MPPGRPTNYDAKIARLVTALRKTLVAREAARIEAAVSKHVDALVASIQGRVHVGVVHPVQAIAAMVTPATNAAFAVAKKIGREGRSSASRALQAAKMKAYWAKRKANEAKRGKTQAPPAAKRTARPKAAAKGRSRQIAAMKAYWAKKNATKAKAAPTPVPAVVPAKWSPRRTRPIPRQTGSP